MGPVGQVVDDFLATLGDELSTEPVVFFADQSMAFERVGWLWFSMVLTGWQVPRWIFRGMLSLAKNCAVQAFRGGRPGPVRPLSRSLGMGGTGSPLGWSMSYDPIIWFVGEAVRLRRPTYVDDTAALAVGPHQTFRAQVALLLAGHAAGLRILTHTCQWLEIDNPRISS